MTREEAIQKRDVIVTQFINELGVTIETNTKPLIHCKDCRHAEHREQMPNQVYCKRDKLSTFCAAHDNDDYCKYGERQCNYFGERREP